MEEKRKSSLVDNIKKALNTPAPPMNLPPEYDYRPGKRGGAILIDKASGKERYATDEEKEKYNISRKTSGYYRRKAFKGNS